MHIYVYIVIVLHKTHTIWLYLTVGQNRIFKKYNQYSVASLTLQLSPIVCLSFDSIFFPPVLLLLLLLLLLRNFQLFFGYLNRNGYFSQLTLSFYLGSVRIGFLCFCVGRCLISYRSRFSNSFGLALIWKFKIILHFEMNVIFVFVSMRFTNDWITVIFQKHNREIVSSQMHWINEYYE